MFNPQILKLQAEFLCRTPPQTSSKQSSFGKAPHTQALKAQSALYKAAVKIELQIAQNSFNSQPTSALVQLKQEENKLHGNNLKILQYTLMSLPTLDKKISR